MATSRPGAGIATSPEFKFLGSLLLSYKDISCVSDETTNDLFDEARRASSLMSLWLPNHAAVKLRGYATLEALLPVSGRSKPSPHQSRHHLQRTWLGCSSPGTACELGRLNKEALKPVSVPGTTRAGGPGCKSIPRMKQSRDCPHAPTTITHLKDQASPDRGKGRRSMDLFARFPTR